MKKIIKQNALILLGVLTLVFILFKYFRSFFSGFFTFKQSENFDVFGSTISDNEANQIADSLHTAMGSLGTDFYSILNLFKRIKKASDYSKVYNKFGDRGYIDFIGVGTDVMYPMRLNLTQWLSSELTKKQKTKLVSFAPYLLI